LFASTVAVGAEPSAVPPTGYGALLGQLIIVVAVVCGLAYVVLRFGVKRLVAPRSNGPMEIIGRLAVGPGRSILVVRVGTRHLVLGSSEAGFTHLAELEADEVDSFVTVPDEGRPVRFRDFLQNAKGEG
jgi:flagellar biosynthetic protein FliO